MCNCGEARLQLSQNHRAPSSDHAGGLADGEDHFIIERGFEMGHFACSLASGALLLVAGNISFGATLGGSRNAAATLSSLDLSGLGTPLPAAGFARISALML
jgi:hypothetical protein